MKKKKPELKAGIAVEGEILPTWEIDWGEWAKKISPEKWTRGPILPVGGEERSARNGKRTAKSRKKRA